MTLAAIRRELRLCLHFSSEAAGSKGLQPQQHQALLAIAGAKHQSLTVGELAEALLLKPHSASGIVSRLEALGMVERSGTNVDARQRLVRLTKAGAMTLAALSEVHRAEFVRLRTLLVNLLKDL